MGECSHDDVPVLCEDIHAVLPADGLEDSQSDTPVEHTHHGDAFTALQDDFPPEVIEHQLTGITVVARSSESTRKKYETTVSFLLFSVFYIKLICSTDSTIALVQATPTGVS